MLLVLLDMENDSVDAIPFAVQQMAGGIAKLFRLGNDATPAGKPAQAENGLK
jgi:hypothetical protein